MNNLAQYDQLLQDSSHDVAAGYASDDVVHPSGRSRERKTGGDRRNPIQMLLKEEEEGDGGGGRAAAKKQAPKDWESMSLSEKVVGLYVGEKGLLFWLNKFAYTSIFIVIGGWILF